MPRDDQSAFIRIQTRGLRKAEKMTDLDQKYIRQLIQETIDEVGIVAVDIIADNAPERSGRLKSGVHITGRNRSTFRPSVRVGVEGARNEGFDYVNATRFGRRAVVASKSLGSAKAARSYSLQPGSPGAQLRPFRAHTLSFEPGEPGTRTLYRHGVKAYRPARDWVRLAEDDIKVMADYAFAKVTKEIEKVLKRPGVSAPRAVGVSIKSRFGKFS
jgi:hypothetical protein